MGQMLSKGQVYSEELKSQFAEHMPGAMKIAAQAWAELNNLPADEGSMKRLSKDMEDGKIAGAMVAPFIERMTSIMGSRANDGGRLDIIRQSGDAATARRENVMQQNLAGAWNANGGELKNAVQEFQGAAVPLLRELGPLLKLSLRIVLLSSRALRIWPSLWLSSFRGLQPGSKDSPRTHTSNESLNLSISITKLSPASST